MIAFLVPFARPVPLANLFYDRYERENGHEILAKVGRNPNVLALTDADDGLGW